MRVRTSSGRWWWLGARGWGPALRSVFGLAVLAGCAGASAAVAPPEVPRQVEPPPPPPLRPLTSEEAELRAALEKDCAALVELGPRSLVHSWNLHSATDHLAITLEKLGYQVVRQGFAAGDEVLQNLEVVLPGLETSEALVIAAHYDTAAESPGANASATGAVALLALAKELKGKRFARGVRLVWLSNEAGGGGTPGSVAFVAHTLQQQVPVAATLTLGSLGNYSVARGSQRYPEELLFGAERRSPFGDFVAVLSNAGSHRLLERVRPTLSTASLPVEELVLPDEAPLASDGPQARFWSAGLAGLVLTDTAQFRTPHPEGPEDTPDKVDFDRLARVTRLLGELVTTLADAPGDALEGPGESPDDTPPAAAAPGELMPELPPLTVPAAKNPG